jgi:nicotinamide mononucleotide (NMN) deamidase PncC
MLRKWLVDARKKPKYVRDNIAFVIAGSFTTVLLMAWLVFMPGKIIQEVAEKPAVNNGAFTTFIDQLKEQMAGVSEAVPEETATSSQPQSPIAVLSASSTDWNLSSTTIKAEAVPREVPIVVVPRASSTPAATSTEPNP